MSCRNAMHSRRPQLFAVALAAVAGVCVSSAIARDVELRVVAIAPQEPSVDRIFCSLSLDGWPAGGRELPRIAPGVFATQWRLPTGQRVEYKFLRTASWAAVEKDASGAERDNRVFTVPTFDGQFVSTNVIARWADHTAAPLQALSERPTNATSPRHPATATRSGDIREHTLTSPQLQNARKLWVYLPPDYESNTAARYPVLYLLDGHNLFDAATSFKGDEWGVDEAAEELIAARQIHPCIIVAIGDAGARMQEFAPPAWAPSGRGDQFLDFVADTLKPFIDQTYRTRPDRRHHYVGGASMGGLIAAHAAATKSDVFGGFVIIEPSFRGSYGPVLQNLLDHLPPTDAKVWIEIGAGNRGLEHRVLSALGAQTPAAKLADRLRARDTAAQHVHFAEQPGGFHDERAWARRVRPMLRFFFGEDPSVDE